MKRSLYLFLLLVVIFGLWFFREPVQNGLAWFSDGDAIVTSMQNAGVWGPAMLAVLFILQVFLAFIPGQALMVASGFVYGFWGGFLISWLSLVMGGEIAFILARRYGRSFAERWVASDVLARWDHAARGQGLLFFAIMLVMPLVPNDAMCYVAGLGHISRTRFSIANFLGRGAACMITSALGAFSGHISWQGWVFAISLFVVIGVAWMIFKAFRARRLAS